MPRIRTIKPEFWQHEELASVSEHARLLAIALLNHCDDEGYFQAHVGLVRSACFPFEDDSTNVRRSLDELSSIGYVQVRRGGGKTIGRVVKFSEHQRIDRPQKSKFADDFEQIINENQGETPFDERSTNVRRTLDDESLLEQGTGNREQGTGKGNREGEIEDSSELEEPAREPASPPSDRSPRFPCSGRKGDPDDYRATDEQIDGWVEAYPAVDVIAELRKAKAWLDSNKAKRKTHRGMPAFLNRWMSRQQDQGGTTSVALPRAGPQTFAQQRLTNSAIAAREFLEDDRIR